jgi:hypothetical protein
MNIEQFIKHYDLKNNQSLFTANISENIQVGFEENRESIIKSYFDDIFNKINEKRFTDLGKYHIILGIYPFNQKDGIQFLNVIKSINLIIENNQNEVTSDLLDFEWILLDHILHDYLIEEVESEFKTELVSLKSRLKNVNRFEDEIALLEQKIEHFGIK